MRISTFAVALVVVAATILARPSVARAAVGDAASFEQLRLPVFKAGATQDAWVVAWDRGDTTWASTALGGVYLSYHWRRPSGEVVVWDGLRTALPSPIVPGDARSIQMRVEAPPPGEYLLEIAMVREGVAWFGSYTAAASTFVETYVAALGPLDVPPADPGARVTLSTYVKNIGTATWNASGPNPVRVAYHWYDQQGNVVVWDGERAPLDADIAPGEQRTVQLPVVLPSRLGLYVLRVELVREALFWFSAQSSNVSEVSVSVPSGFLPQLRDAPPPSSLSATPNDLVAVPIRVRNAGTRTWPAGGVHPVRLAYHLRDGGAYVVWDGERASLPYDLAPGQEVTLTLTIRAPATRGAFYVYYDLVDEGVAWFADFAPKSPLAVSLLVTQ